MKKIIFIVALITALAFASGVMAQQKPAPAPAKPATTPAPAPKAPEKPKLEKFSGAIEKVDEMAKTVVVKGKKEEKTFAMDEKTKITRGKKGLTFADLKKGMSVSVESKKEGEKVIAVAIKVAGAGPAPVKKEKPAEKPAEAPKK